MRGNNRILIQTGSSEVDDQNFLLRITDDKGMPIEGLTFSTTHRRYASDYSYESRIIPIETEEYLLSKLEEHPDQLMYYLVLARHYLSTEKTYQALHLLKDARELFPDCSYLTIKALWAYAQDDNRPELSKSLEEIKRKDPDYPLAQNELFNEAIRTKNYSEAHEILAKIEQRNPYSPDVYSKKIELASEEEEYDELISLILEAYRRHPGNYEFVNLRVLVEKEVRNNVRGAIRIMRRYLRRNYNPSAMNELAGLYMSIGQLPRGIKLIEEQIRHNPIAIGSYHYLSQIYFHTGDYVKALEMLEECIQIAPYISRYHVGIGDIHAERRRTFMAKEAYEKGILLNPQNYDARDKLRKLEGLDDIFDTFETIDVDEIFENSPNADDYPDDNSILLVDVVQTVVYPGGGSQEKHTLVAKVFDTKGVDAWKELSIPIYGNQRAIILKMEVLKKNGSRIEADRSGAYVVFPNLEEGDAIHVSWKVSNYYHGDLARNFWDHQYFNYSIPAHYISYQLLVPNDYEFRYVTQNLDLEPEITTHGGYQMYVWSAKDRPALKDERYMPRLSEVSSMLYMSSFNNWNEIASWYADLAHAKAKVDFQVGEVVKELFEGREDEELSDFDKVKGIYAYIIRNIRYSSVPFLQSALVPRKASRTLSQGQGDCKDVSTLFVAMCKAVGIDANIVLVRTRGYGVNSLPLPEIGFNHAIAKITMDGEDYYIELTSDNLPFAGGLSSVKQVFTLEIPLDREMVIDAKIIDPPTRVPNDLIRKSVVTFEDETMRVEKESWRTGVEAAFYRDRYKELGSERRHQRMQESITRLYPNIRLTSFEFDESLDDLSDTLYYTHSYEVPNIFTEVGRMQIFELPWGDKFESPTFMATDDRVFPIELWIYLDVEKYNEVLYIEVPEGKRLADLPRNISLSCHNAEYSLTFKREGNRVVAERTLVIKVDRVMPEHYAEFKTFLGDVVRSDRQQIGFNPASTARRRR